jgi:hypothetical protein
VHVRHFGQDSNPGDDSVTLTLTSAGTAGVGGGTGGGSSSGGSGGGGGSGSSGGTAPRVIAPPVVPPSATIGTTVKATVPRWSSTPKSVAYQWKLCGAAGCTTIKGGTRTTLKLAPAYAGKSVQLVATAKIAGKTVTSTSKKTLVKKKG